MINLYFIMPLVTRVEMEGKTIEATKMVLGYGAEAMTGLQTVGMGIASIILLFVIFRYISAMLNGGRFELKMLFPLLIYLMVCNFNLVCRPVVNFTTLLQSKSVEACKGLKAKYMNVLTDNHFSEDPNFLTAYIYASLKKKPSTSSTIGDTAKKILENPDAEESDFTEISDAEANGGSSPSEGADDSEERRGWLSGFREALSNFWRKNVLSHIWEGWLIYDVSEVSVTDFMKLGITALLASILQFLCSAFSIVLSVFSAVMTGIIVSFGPITFAFAVFPGNGKVIGAWIIRLCQYALYAPIAALIEAFTAIVLGESLSMGFSGMLLIVAILICNLVALTAIPSIASSIIEGASGAVSLSSGLQSIGAGLTAASSVLASPFHGAQRALDMVNSVSSLRHYGREKSSDEMANDYLKNISSIMSKHFGDGDSEPTPSGLQPNGDNSSES